MKRNIITLIVALVVFGCSDNQGELVDSSSDANSTQQEENASLPQGHPPIDQNQMGGTSTAQSSGTSAQMPTIEGDSATVAFLTFKIAPEWTMEQPSSSMRAAQFSLPPAEGESEAAELVLFHGIGGSAEANIQRWIGQFQQPDGSSSSETADINNLNIDDFTVMTLDITGTYTGAMGPMMGGGEAQENYRMLAAVIIGPNGPWQFKLTGPAPTVEKWKSDFEQMIKSIQPAS